MKKTALILLFLTALQARAQTKGELKTADFIRIPLSPGKNRVEACCVSGVPEQGNPENIIDGNARSFWASNYGVTYDAANAPDNPRAREDFYGPHYITIDLGRVYDNVSRIEYLPAWTWMEPGGYPGGANNGFVTSFEVYLSETPYMDSGNRAAYGEWYALERDSNLKINTKTMRFFATFASARGRYLQFRMLAAYRNHWAGNLPLAVQIAGLRVWRTAEPIGVDTRGLEELVREAGALRADFPEGYGYTNAILDNWTGRVKRYLDNPAGLTRESVEYVRTNLENYIALAERRKGSDSYNRFVQKIIWADDRGNHLQAHGGGLLWDPAGRTWWLYGEDRTNTSGGRQPGVHAYSSSDLYNWKDEGIALPIFNNTVYDEPGWRESASADPDGFPGGWDGGRLNSSGAAPAASADNPQTSGFMWAVNEWRHSLGDWNADGIIEPEGEAYAGGRLDGNAANERRGPLSKAEQEAAWDAIKNHLPEGNPPLYTAQDGRPYPSALGLTEDDIAALNALYADTPVWRRKQLYRFWNHLSIVERPKVIFNAGQGPYKTGTGVHALSGKPIRPYTDDTGTYPYVMFVHIESGVPGVNYGTAKTLVAAAKQPQGPFKVLWAYHKHFAEFLLEGTNHMGMSRDQSVLLDDDGTAYHIASTQENRIMGIDILDESYTCFAGAPRFPAGSNLDQMLEEGYDNRLGVYFNFVYGNQREAPAPFLHYTEEGMTGEGRIREDGLDPPGPESKLYYMATSTSTGWFPNTQGIYRTSRPGGPILGGKDHEKPSALPVDGTADGAPPDPGVTGGSGWIGVTGNESSLSGSRTSFFFGSAEDGSIVTKGFDGQTAHVQQLRYPAYKWGITGYLDEEKRKPVYGELAGQIEPRAGRPVYGKYLYMADSWDQTKNYDARYIWLPMRVLPAGKGNNSAAGARVRWMREWRWEEFVYDLGPFAGSLDEHPPPVPDSSGGLSPSMWTGRYYPQNLSDYYEMLEETLGSSVDWYHNPGKQNPGQDWLVLWREKQKIFH